MEKSVLKRYQAAIEQAETDTEYCALDLALRKLEPELSALLESLAEEQSDIIVDYLGICAQINERLLEIACQC